jgi:hypothetical protein
MNPKKVLPQIGTLLKRNWTNFGFEIARLRSDVSRLGSGNFKVKFSKNPLRNPLPKFDNM